MPTYKRADNDNPFASLNAAAQAPLNLPPDAASLYNQYAAPGLGGQGTPNPLTGALPQFDRTMGGQPLGRDFAAAPPAPSVMTQILDRAADSINQGNDWAAKYLGIALPTASDLGHFYSKHPVAAGGGVVGKTIDAFTDPKNVDRPYAAGAGAMVNSITGSSDNTSKSNKGSGEPAIPLTAQYGLGGAGAGALLGAAMSRKGKRGRNALIGAGLGGGAGLLADYLMNQNKTAAMGKSALDFGEQLGGAFESAKNMYNSVPESVRSGAGMGGLGGAALGGLAGLVAPGETTEYDDSGRPVGSKRRNRFGAAVRGALGGGALGAAGGAAAGHFAPDHTSQLMQRLQQLLGKNPQESQEVRLLPSPRTEAAIASQEKYPLTKNKRFVMGNPPANRPGVEALGDAGTMGGHGGTGAPPDSAPQSQNDLPAAIGLAARNNTGPATHTPTPHELDVRRSGQARAHNSGVSPYGKQIDPLTGLPAVPWQVESARQRPPGSAGAAQ